MARYPCRNCKENNPTSHAYFYMYCSICKRCAHRTNYKHCDKCNTCVLKAYPHCDICNKCVNYKFKHCEKCNICHNIKFKYCPYCKKCISQWNYHITKCSEEHDTNRKLHLSFILN